VLIAHPEWFDRITIRPEAFGAAILPGDLVLGPVSQILLGLLALSWSGKRLVHAYAERGITFFAWCSLIAGAALTRR